MREITPELAAKAASDLAHRGRYGSLVYLAVWLVVVSAHPLQEMLSPTSLAGAVIFLLLGLTRLALCLGFERYYPARPLLWERAYAVTALALGLTWGLLFAYTSWAYRLEWAAYLSLIATAGIVCGGILGLNTHLKLLQGYVLCMLAPGAVSGLAMGSHESTALALLLILAAGFLLLIGRQSHNEYWSALTNTELLTRRAEELELSRERAEAADQAKRRYLANTSHEIRTPMNGVIGMIDLLKHCPDPGHKREYLDTMERSAQSILKLMDDVLDLSKIESNRLTLDRAVFRPAEIATDVHRLFLEAALKKRIEFRVRCSESASQALIGDPHRLRQVLTNLVSNAIKFTEQGQVAVQLDVLQESNDCARLRFAVQDSGIGIAPHALELIFEAFEQADPSTTGSYGGTGLGLTISKQIVEHMGGELQVASTPGQGSHFSFELKFEKLARETVPAQHAGTVAHPCAELGLKLLLAEDNRVNCIVTERFLAVLGCHCTIVSSGREALKAFAAGEFDMLLMDCEMADMDGFQATRKIRKLEQVRGQAATPIVAITAHAIDDARDAALNAGMTDFLGKPFTLNQLEQVLRSNAPHGGSSPPDGLTGPQLVSRSQGTGR